MKRKDDYVLVDFELAKKHENSADMFNDIYMFLTALYDAKIFEKQDLDKFTPLKL